MKRIWLTYFIFLIVQINCQDEDYDIEPDDSVNSDTDYSPSKEPDFFKNAFGTAPAAAGPRQNGDLLFNPHPQYYPYAPISDGRSMYSPYSYPMHTSQSMNFDSSVKSDKMENKPFRNGDDDYFSDFDKSKESHFNSFNKPKSLDYNNGLSSGMSNGLNNPIMYNYGFPSPYANLFAGRFNPMQSHPHAGLPMMMRNHPVNHPVGSHLFPYTQQRKKKDDFDEELKKLGINLSEYGLGSSNTEENEEKTKKDKDKKKRKKKNKKRPGIFPILLNPIIRPASTESPTQNQYLKSNVDNDISNLGLNMADYGIKEHKLEQQVYGNRYQYPMQVNNQNNYQNSLINPTGFRDVNSGELDLKSSLNNLNQYSDNKLNSLLKLDPTNDQTLMPMLNSNPQNALNPITHPVFTTADNPLDGSFNANEIAAINLIENSLGDLNGVGKAHEYLTNDYNSMHNDAKSNHELPPNINENFKQFVPVSKANKNRGTPPKFLDDEFFKEGKSKNNYDNEAENEPVRKSKKVVYKLNSEVKSNKYFESITPKSKNYKDDSSDDYEDKIKEDKYSKEDKYNSKDEDKYSKEDKYNGKDEEKYSKEDKYNGKEDDKYSKEEENQNKPKYSDDKSVDYKSTTYSKEYKPPTQYKFGYRYYGQNNHQTSSDDYENKKSNPMKLVSNDNDQIDAKSNNDQDEKVDDKASAGEVEDKDESNETNSPIKEENLNNANSNEEINSNDDGKVDEEFSGSKRYARSVSNNDYFKLYRSNQKSYLNEPILARSNLNRATLNKPNSLGKRQEMYEDNDFGDSEDYLIERPRILRKSFYPNKRIILRPIEDRFFEEYSDNSDKIQRRELEKRKKKILVSFDTPPDNYEKRNFDTAFNDENFKLIRNKPRIKQFKSLEYDELKPFGIPKSKLERRKCNPSLARFKRLHRVYSKDNRDFYSNLSKNPLYKKYQYL